MSRKGKPKNPQPRQVDPPANPASKGAGFSAFNYSWRTPVALAALLLTLLIFLALPFYPEVAGYPRWLVAAIGAGELPAALSEAFGSAEPIAIGERFLIVGQAFLTLLLATGIGLVPILLFFCDREHGVGEGATLSVGIGLATLSTLTFAAAATGWHGPGSSLGIAFVLFPVAIVAGLLAIRRRYGRWWPPRKRDRPEFPLSLWLLVGVPATVMAVLFGMNPPYDFDVLEYHFQIPKEWHFGGVGRSEGNVYGAMPQGAEMFVLWGMGLSTNSDEWWRGALVGKTILAAFIPLTSLLSASIAGRIAGRAAGLFAGWTALTIPGLWSVGVAGLVDHVWAFFFLAAGWTAFRTWFVDRSKLDEPSAVADRASDLQRPTVGEWTLRAKPSLRLATLAGAFFGAAAACKYPAVPLIGGPLVVFHLACFVVASRRAGFDFARFAKATALAGIAAAILAGPWYVKNAVLYGNPVFPLATGLLGDAGWPDELQANWAKAHQVPGDTAWKKWSPIGFARSAWHWIFSSGGASPLVPLGLVALALAKRPPRATWILLSLATGFFVIFWLATHRIDRFLVPTYPLLAVAAGVGFAAGASSFDRQMRQVAFWLGLVWCVIVIPYLRIDTYVDARLLAPLDRLRVADGFGDLPPRIQPPVEWLNRNVEKGTVLSIGDAAVFDFQIPVRYHTCFDESPLQIWYDEAGGDPARLHERLKEEGISFVYVHWGEIARYRATYGFPFPVAHRDRFAEFAREGVLLPAVQVGPPMEDGTGPLWAIYPVAEDGGAVAPSTAAED